MKIILRLLKYMIAVNFIAILIILGIGAHNQEAMKSQIYDLGTITLQMFRAVRPMFWNQQGINSPMMQEFMDQFSSQSTVQNFFVFTSKGEIVYAYRPPPDFLVSAKLPNRLIYHHSLVLYDRFAPHGGNMRGNAGRHSGYGKNQPEELIACIVIDVTKLSISKKFSMLSLFLGLVIQAVLFFLYFRCKKLLHLYEQSEIHLRQIEQEATAGRLAAILAHEIKNPLSSMRGLISYSVKKSDQEKVVESLEKSLDEIDRLSAIVNSFLAFGKPFDLKKTELSVTTLLEKTLHLFSYDINAKRITVEVSGGEFTVLADDDKLLQVFVNIIVNALEAAPVGSVVKIVKDGAEKTVRITNQVADGHPVDSSRFFEPFFTTKAKGSGLGLAISKKIMDLHNFDISIEGVDPFTVKISFLQKVTK